MSRDDDRPMRGDLIPPSRRSPFPNLPGLPGERRGWLRSTLSYWLDFYSERRALESLARAYDAASRTARAAEGFQDALVGFQRSKGRADDIDIILEEDRDVRRTSASDAKLNRLKAEQRLNRFLGENGAGGTDDPEHLDEQTRVEEARGRLHRARERRKTDDEKRRERMKRISGQPVEVIDTLLDMHEEHQQRISEIDELVAADLLSRAEAEKVKKLVNDAYRTAVERIKSGIY